MGQVKKAYIDTAFTRDNISSSWKGGRAALTSDIGDSNSVTIGSKVLSNKTHTENMAMLNVMDYGAYNDSTNANATRLAIKAASDDAWNSDPKLGVFFPPGIFLIDSTLNIKPNYYYGVAGKTKIVTNNNDEYIFSVYTYASHVNNTEECYFKDLILIGAAGDYTANPPTGTGRGGCLNIAFTGGSTYLKKAVLDNIKIDGFYYEGLQVKQVMTAIIKDCEVKNCSQYSINPARNKYIEVINCKVSNSRTGIEVYAKDPTVSAANPDNSIVLIDNFIANNLHGDGIVLYGGNSTISNSSISFYDTTINDISSNSGIRIQGIYNRYENITIKDTKIDSAILYGIHFVNSTYAPDNVDIYNCNITNSNRAGINISLTGGTGDRKINIYNNKIIDFNRARTTELFSAGLSINSKNVTARNNTIYFSDTTGTLFTTKGYFPVYIGSGLDSIIIDDNNFKSPDGRDNQIMFYDSNTGTYSVRNNKGLGFERAIKIYAGGAEHYQLSNNTISGDNYISEIEGNISFSTKVINSDSLCVVKYNSSGAAIDTSTRINR